MSTNANKYSENYIQQQVIDYLEKDGALCDYYSKYYKEKETYDGGVGDRQAFKNYNDKINKYHNILKALTGEERANIYESIPAIDFTSPEFTSFYYTYNITTDSATGQTTINNDEIVPIPEEENKSAIELIEDEDKYTINRALMGEKVAEHFYNTTSLTSDCYDIQVSPYIFEKDKYEYIYCGVLSPKTFKDGVYTDDIRVTDMLYYPVSSSQSMYFNSDTPRMYGIYNGVYLDNTPCLVDVLQSDESLDSTRRVTTNIVLNADCHWTPYDENAVEITGFKTGIKHADSTEFSDKNIAQELDNKESVEYLYFGHYMLNLDAGDFIVAIPSNAYTLSSTKLIIFKKNNTDSTETATYSYETAYFNSYNTRFYEDTDFNVAVNPSADKYKDKYFVNISDETVSGVYCYSDLTTAFSKVDVESIDTATKTITLKKSKNPYTCYVLYIQGFNKDLNSFSSASGYDPASMFTKVSAGDKMPSELMNDFIYEKLKDYISVEVNYLAGASGLLAGYFSVPYSTTASVNADVVDEWSFYNQRQTALSNGIDIDIGAKYYSGHLLNRGKMIASPLRLTSKDSIDNKDYNTLLSEGIKGKATLLYKKIIAIGNIYDKIFSNYCVDDNSSFYQSKNTIEKVITQDNFKDGTLYFKDRFKRTNTESPVDIEDIYTYIRTWQNYLKGDTLTIDLNADAVKCQSASNKTEGAGIFISGNKSSSGSSLSDFSNLRKEINKDTIEGGSPAIIAFYYISQTTTKWWGSSSYTRFSRMYTSLYTPWDLLRCKNSNNTNLLIFPSEKKYFPEEAILISRKDLKLKKDNPCFFHKNGKLLGFYVKDAISILPSAIRKINIRENGSVIQSVDLNRVIFLPNFELLDDEYSESTELKNKYYNGWRYMFAQEKDCYIYKLSCLTCKEIQNNFVFYDEDDEPIEISDMSSYGKMLPLSYAVNSSDTLFKGEKILSDDGEYCVYSINPDNRNDFYALEGFNIFSGVPKYTLKDNNCIIAEPSSSKLFKLRLFDFARSFTNTFSSLLTNSNGYPKDLVTGMMRDILSNWKFSNSSTNPILLKNLPSIFEGLLTMSRELHDLSNEGITVESNGRTLNLSRKNFQGLIDLIDKGVSVRKYDFDIEIPSDITTVDTSSGKTTACNNYMKSQLNKISVAICNPDGTSWESDHKEYYTKSSIKSLNNIFNTLFTNSSTITTDSEMEGFCKQLDNCFGNNTQPFLSIGESVTSSGETVDNGASVESFREEILKKLAKVVAGVVKSVMSDNTNSKAEEALAEARTNYSNYYTEASVAEGVTLTADNKLSVDFSKLIPLKSQKSLLLEAYDNANWFRLF